MFMLSIHSGITDKLNIYFGLKDDDVQILHGPTIDVIQHQFFHSFLEIIFCPVQLQCFED